MNALLKDSKIPLSPQRSYWGANNESSICGKKTGYNYKHCALNFINMFTILIVSVTKLSHITCFHALSTFVSKHLRICFWIDIKIHSFKNDWKFATTNWMISQHVSFVVTYTNKQGVLIFMSTAMSSNSRTIRNKEQGSYCFTM